MEGSTSTVSTPTGEEPFLAQLLSLLQGLNHSQPTSSESTFSFTFPPSPSATPPTLPSYTGPGRSATTDAIHTHLQSLALRLHQSDTVLAQVQQYQQQNPSFAGQQSDGGGGGLVTPEITPPIPSYTSDDAQQPFPLTNLPSRLLSSLATSLPLIGSTSATGEAVDGYSSSGLGLSAVDELALLKRQVGDVARVCKVSSHQNGSLSEPGG